MLTTFSGYERCASIVCITNSKDYLTNIESFLSSVNVKKPETTITNNQGSHSKEVISNNSSVVGVWGKTSTANSDYGLPVYQRILFRYTGVESSIIG